MTGAMRLCQLDANTVRHQHVEYPPQQCGAPHARDRVEDHDHRAVCIGQMCKRIGESGYVSLHSCHCTYFSKMTFLLLRHDFHNCPQ